MPDDRPPRPSGTDAGWGFAILAAVIAVILVGWGWAGAGARLGPQQSNGAYDAARGQLHERAGHTGGNSQHAVKRTLTNASRRGRHRPGGMRDRFFCCSSSR